MIEEATLLAWSWEFYIRTELLGEAAEDVTASWTSIPAIIKHRLPEESASAPGTVKTRFDAAGERLAQSIHLRDFMARYAEAINAGNPPPGHK